MLMQWSLSSENLRNRLGSTAAERKALNVVGISDPSRASTISQEIDALFRNSNAETKVNTSDALEKLAKERPTKVAEMLKSTWLNG